MNITSTSDLNFGIQDLERAASQRDFATFFDLLRELLMYLNKGRPVFQKRTLMEDGRIEIVKGGVPPLHTMMTYEEKLDWVNRLAAAITIFLSDTQHRFTPHELSFLTLFKTNLSDLFYISSYGSMDHILFNRGLLNKDYHLQLKTAQDIDMLLVCLTLQSRIMVDYEMLMDASNLGPLAYLAMFHDYEHPFSDKILENFRAAIACQEKILEKVDITNDHHIELMLNPWMGCSYWDINDRHRLKQIYNQMIEKWLERKLPPGLKKRVAANASRKGPIKRVVVASEKYISGHAMYRCYHRRILALRKKYEVILVTSSKDYDERSARDFHQVIEVDDGCSSIAETISKIVKLEPDLIYFPSLGMAKWTILLSNVRIANKQVMSYGHPASAFSRHIDYGIAGGLHGLSADLYQPFLMEKLVPIFQSESNYEPHPDFSPEAIQRKRLNDGIVRIAINSSLAKISSRIINLCGLLVEHSSVPLEFHFFMVHNRSWKNLAFEKSLKKRIGPNIVVHDPQPYLKYMDNLAVCDLAIGTFPFGGSNTNVDLLLLGIPKIFYTEGSDIASFTDMHVLKTFEIDDMLHAKSEGELIANLVYLIHNGPERERLSQMILNQNPVQKLYNSNRSEFGTHYVEAFDWIENQATIASV